MSKNLFSAHCICQSASLWSGNSFLYNGRVTRPTMIVVVTKYVKYLFVCVLRALFKVSICEFSLDPCYLSLSCPCGLKNEGNRRRRDLPAIIHERCVSNDVLRQHISRKGVQFTFRVNFAEIQTKGLLLFNLTTRLFTPIPMAVY